jgi:hypothetical protein
MWGCLVVLNCVIPLLLILMLLTNQSYQAMNTQFLVPRFFLQRTLAMFKTGLDWIGPKRDLLCLT